MAKKPTPKADWRKPPFTVEEETRAVYLRWKVLNADKALVAYLPERQMAETLVSLWDGTAIVNLKPKAKS